jgi:hypothetical protein
MKRTTETHLRILLRQRTSVRVLMVSQTNVQRLHALVRRQHRVVRIPRRDMHFVGEDQRRRAHDAVAGVESAGLRDGS